jgi:hypothetical protein
MSAPPRFGRSASKAALFGFVGNASDHNGVAEMPEYRLYCLDGGGQIGFADLIEAISDADAIAMAREIKRNGQKCEVWRRAKLIATLDGHDLAG